MLSVGTPIVITADSQELAHFGYSREESHWLKEKTHAVYDFSMLGEPKIYIRKGRKIFQVPAHWVKVSKTQHLSQ